MSDNGKHIKVSPELLIRANRVREYAEACNSVVKELIHLGVEVEYYFNGKKLPDGVFGLDLEIRMTLPQEPITL